MIEFKSVQSIDPASVEGGLSRGLSNIADDAYRKSPERVLTSNALYVICSRDQAKRIAGRPSVRGVDRFLGMVKDRPDKFSVGVRIDNNGVKAFAVAEHNTVVVDSFGNEVISGTVVSGFGFKPVDILAAAVKLAKDKDDSLIFALEPTGHISRRVLNTVVPGMKNKPDYEWLSAVGQLLPEKYYDGMVSLVDLPSPQQPIHAMVAINPSDRGLLTDSQVM